MKPLPGIAVVIPCYNLGPTVEEAIDSVLRQSRRASEIVVVDDGSTDIFTRQVLAGLDRPGTRVVTIPHAGVAAARNRGVAMTESPYILLLDADDVMGERCLERMGERLDKDVTLGFVSCALQAFEGATYTWKPPSVEVVGTLTRGSVHISSLFRRTLWDAVGGFDEELPAYEDLDFWLHALRGGFRGDILDEPLIRYRVRPDSRYRKGIESDTYRRAMARILERHRPVLDDNGIGVLAEKESFLLDLFAYHDQLLERQRSLRQRLNQLDEQIAAARHVWSERMGGNSTAGREVADDRVLAPWRDSGLKSRIEQFVKDHQWLIRGHVSLVVDEAWAADGLQVPRWDEGSARTSFNKHLLGDAIGLEAASKDAVLLLLLSPIQSIEEAIERIAALVKPGGALLVVTSVRRRQRVAEEAVGCDHADAWARASLARAFPIEAFDVTVGGDLVTATVRIGESAHVPRRRRRRSPSSNAPPSTGAILAYHRIAALRPDTHRLCVSPAHFRQQMRCIREHYTVMSLTDLFLASRVDALPPRAVAVTFDDGYIDALTTAAPILEEERVPATFFLNTERLSEEHEGWHDRIEHILLSDTTLPPALELVVGDRALQLDVRTSAERRHAQMVLHGAFLSATAIERERMLAELVKWSGALLPTRPERRLLVCDEVVKLSRVPGCEIGSHSVHHLLLPLHQPEVQLAELRAAKECLEELIDRAVLSFAYPYGEHDAALEERIRRTPHLCAVTARAGLVTASTDPMRLPRLEAPDADGWVLGAALEGLFESAGTPASAGGASPPPESLERETLRRTASDFASVTNRQLARLEYQTGQVVLSARPQFLIIDPTSRCNARCVMCPVSFRPPGDNGMDLDRSVFDKLLSVIPTAKQINLFSSGEPTIARDILYVIDETSRMRNSEAVIWLSTNGKRLPPRILESVMAPRMGLQFSVDGGTKEVFDYVRRGIAFEELCRSLELAQERKGTQPFPALSFSTTLSKRNIHDLANIFALAKRYGIQHVYFYEADPEVAEEEQYALDETDRGVFDAQLPSIEQTRVPYSNGLYFRGLEGLRAAEPPPPANPPVIHCLAPWTVFHQRADATVRTCCTLRKSMGNLRHASFEEIWNGEEYVKLRRAFVEQSGIPGTCYRCTDPLRTYSSEQMEHT
jgi:MoaA/NifB/PqqE/SkfB family radical SAM enzyme/peptidoglycan/xylan/chitin deacetylase (PgdA/CDA1 family)/glycosyltransferase involved in cell wall biosynthesis